MQVCGHKSREGSPVLELWRGCQGRLGSHGMTRAGCKFAGGSKVMTSGAARMVGSPARTVGGTWCGGGGNDVAQVLHPHHALARPLVPRQR